jgi:hypothetical protein
MIGAFWRRLKLLLHRDRAIADLEEEMRLHRELRAESLRRQGLPNGTAEAEAARRFGRSLDVTERGRIAWGAGCHP